MVRSGLEWRNIMKDQEQIYSTAHVAAVTQVTAKQIRQFIAKDQLRPSMKGQKQGGSLQFSFNDMVSLLILMAIKSHPCGLPARTVDFVACWLIDNQDERIKSDAARLVIREHFGRARPCIAWEETPVQIECDGEDGDSDFVMEYVRVLNVVPLVERLRERQKTSQSGQITTKSP